MSSQKSKKNQKLFEVENWSSNARDMDSQTQTDQG
jgi:hypothetical protein